MRWPWSKQTEQRASYSDAVVKAILAGSQGGAVGDPGAIAALETAAGLYARSFASAQVNPTGNARTAAITPSILASIARSLIRNGESLHLIEITRFGLKLSPVGSWDIQGGDDPASWYVRADLFGASASRTVFYPHASFVHCRYAVDPSRPYRGIGPLQWASDTGILAANLEKRLGEEAGGAVAHLLAIPSDGGDGGADDPLAELKADIRAGKGKTLLLETTAAGFGEGRSAAPRKDWEPSRIGANPPQTLPSLRSDAALSVLGACGVPGSLATTQNSDGTAQRESWRRFLHGSVQPLAALVSQELSEKLDVDISLDLSRIGASDISGRARSFGSLVKGGMEIERAAALSGLLSEDE